ncbi:Bowman-Birk type proteinase inhibitor-like [Phalaenopsis equestris]|uniref:Bowman-Birk type proteinase inhibitor-like n=1 Tax=Phalaenopsis equestris TaxID=78828 RepID=UPI0009E5FA9C|nr:Bowman-Birk type proteinase inhibitor-like [Phalaenopsis equestris]
MEHVNAPAGGGNNHIAITLPLVAAFFLVAAGSPHSMAATVPAHKSSSDLKLPIVAARTAVKDNEEACCDECGICMKTWPPICNCRDVHKECPSWCLLCEDVEGGKVCADFRVNYCKNGCNTRKDRCCNKCGVCALTVPPICNCMDVVEECPSWCDRCQDVDGYGRVCADFKPNYCEKSCGT